MLLTDLVFHQSFRAIIKAMSAITVRFIVSLRIIMIASSSDLRWWVTIFIPLLLRVPFWWVARAFLLSLWNVKICLVLLSCVIIWGERAIVIMLWLLFLLSLHLGKHDACQIVSVTCLQIMSPIITCKLRLERQHWLWFVEVVSEVKSPLTLVSVNHERWIHGRCRLLS